MQSAVPTMMNDKVHAFGQVAEIDESDRLKSWPVPLFEVMPLMVFGNDHDDGKLGSLQAIGKRLVDFRSPCRTKRHENDRSTFENQTEGPLMRFELRMENEHIRGEGRGDMEGMKIQAKLEMARAE